MKTIDKLMLLSSLDSDIKPPINRKILVGERLFTIKTVDNKHHTCEYCDMCELCELNENDYVNINTGSLCHGGEYLIKVKVGEEK